MPLLMIPNEYNLSTFNNHHDESFSSLATGPVKDKQSQTPVEVAGIDSCQQYNIE